MRTRRTGIAIAVLALAALPALADCGTELAEVDRRLAEAGPDEQLLETLKMMRDQGETECKAGNEAAAGARFKSILMMLDMQATFPKRPKAEPKPEPEPFTPPNLHTVYVNEQGEGILRYTVPDGGEYSFVTGALTGNADRPIETLGSDGAVFTGPHIARYMWGITGKQVPIDKLVVTLYERKTQRSVAHFKFVVDAAKAEPRENCGEIDPRTDECSIKRPGS